ncbi:MAG: hypothetical protein JW703_00710 [Candidatus Diapherotrites archaeon]|nr:hypothetical protein [Candidatus Diapherotrites archaeon]
MPFLDAQRLTLKGEKKFLKLIFEEGDEILTGIKNAMKENSLKEIKLEEIEGKIKKAKLQYMEAAKLKSREFENIEPIRISGTIKLSFEELFGPVHISFNPKNPISATLLTGIAEQELIIKASYIELK